MEWWRPSWWVTPPVLSTVPTGSTPGARKGLGDQLARIAAMAPAVRFHALEELDPAVRARLLGASALSPHLHETGPAYQFPWASLHVTPGHAGEQAWAAAIASRRVYETFGENGSDPERVGRGFADFARAGYSITFMRGDGGTHAALAHRGDSALLTFRGTDPRVARDLFKDGDAWPVPHPDGGRAHKGFQRGLAEVSTDVLRHLDEARRTNPNLKVLPTGHSLGAAMATLAALELDREGFNLAGVYTFGSPRVVDPELARIYRRRGLDAITYRYRKGLDGVVELPPPLGYKHVGSELYFRVDGGLLVRPSDSAIHADQLLAWCSAFAKQRVLRGEPAISWDHGPGGYVKHCYVNRDVPLPKLRSR